LGEVLPFPQAKVRLSAESVMLADRNLHCAAASPARLGVMGMAFEDKEAELGLLLTRMQNEPKDWHETLRSDPPEAQRAQGLWDASAQCIALRGQSFPSRYRLVEDGLVRGLFKSFASEYQASHRYPPRPL
jgi:hypothetical protein